MVCLSKVVEATKDHRKRNAVKGEHQFFCDGVAPIDEERKAQPGCPNLPEQTIQGTSPQRSQMEQALDDDEGCFTPPATAIPISDHIGRQGGWIQNAGQIGVPGRAKAHVDQAQGSRSPEWRWYGRGRLGR